MLTLDSPISTERLVLRPFTRDDLDDLHAMYRISEVVRYLYWDVLTREEVAEKLGRMVTQVRLAGDHDVLSIAITLQETDRVRPRMIGGITFWWRSVEHHQGEVGFVLHPDYQGKGYGREAAAAIMTLAFDKLKLHRIFGTADARNDASAALMRRLGMRLEAHFVHNEIFKGQWGEEVIYAILDEEWRAQESSWEAGQAEEIPRRFHPY